MADAKRDQNRVTTLLCVDSTGVIRNATIDGVTGYLNMRVAASNAVTPRAQAIASRDNNRVTTKLAVLSNGTPQAALADADGYLFVATS